MSATPGQELRAAREALGKSTSEMAAATRITVQQIEGLESDDYACIPAPMYVRGFLKLYAQELGLNPEPLIGRYEALRDGGPAEKRGSAVERKPPAVSTPAPHDEPDAPGAGGPPRGIFGSRPSPEARAPFLEQWTAWSRNVDLSRFADREWWLNAKPPRILAGLVLGLILVAGLRNCGGGEAAPAGETSEETVKEPEPLPSAADTEIPEPDDPLLRPPSPIVFDPPRTLE